MNKHFVGSFDESILPNLDDFKKYYEGTYLILNSSFENSNIVAVQAVDTVAKKVILHNPILGSVMLSENTETDLLVDFPEPGYFYAFTNDERKPYTIHWYARKPARQWKKAPHPQNTVIFNSFNNRYLRTPKLDWKVLSNIYQSKEMYTKTWHKTLKQIETFQLPVIINRFTVLYPYPKENKYFLFFNNTPVAIYNPKEKKITEHDSNFSQEIYDFFNRQGLRYVFK